MKMLFGMIPALLLGASLLAAEPLRQRLNLNREWKFELGDHPGAEVAGFDDSKWGGVGLPHSFSTPYFQGKDFYTGYGWYRKHFEVPAAGLGRRVCLEFDGAFQDAEVFVNGQTVGRHRGGYTGFSFDITPALHAGGNVLAVRLNNRWSPTLAPRGGDHIFPGGIYRDVWLVVTAPLHVTWYGTFVTTPVVSSASATARVQTEIQNQGPAARDVVVATEILDPGGKPVARFSSPQTINAGATATVDQTSPAIPNPQLWHPAHPFLYTAVTTLSAGGNAVDEYRTPFGIRWIKWTADQGFFINGEHYYFHGANVHQDHAGWANAVTDAGAYRDVKLIKDAGFDFIRGSHYPHHPAFADACDQLGLLFWSENCFWMGGGAHQDGYWTADAYPIHPEQEAAFEQSVEDTLRDEIRILRNHPSIIVWSMCNEVFFSSNQPKVKPLLSRMVGLTHQLDPTRPAAIGGAQRGGLDKLGDVAGYNGDGARLFINPGIPSMVSEYGAQSTPRPGAYNGHFKAKDQLVADTPQYPWRSGQAIWAGFDYGTIFGFGVSKGLIDYARIPKREWYWYRNEYLHLPPPAWPQAGVPARLALTADKTTIAGTDGRDDVHLLVTVQDADGKPISNSPPVTFTIEAGPGEFPTGRTRPRTFRFATGRRPLSFAPIMAVKRSFAPRPPACRTRSSRLPRRASRSLFPGQLPLRRTVPTFGLSALKPRPPPTNKTSPTTGRRARAVKPPTTTARAPWTATRRPIGPPTTASLERGGWWIWNSPIRSRWCGRLFPRRATIATALRDRRTETCGRSWWIKPSPKAPRRAAPTSSPAINTPGLCGSCLRHCRTANRRPSPT